MPVGNLNPLIKAFALLCMVLLSGCAGVVEGITRGLLKGEDKKDEDKKIPKAITSGR